jgi:hypothetical protein
MIGLPKDLPVRPNVVAVQFLSIVSCYAKIHAPNPIRITTTLGADASVALVYSISQIHRPLSPFSLIPRSNLDLFVSFRPDVGRKTGAPTFVTCVIGTDSVSE